MDDKSLDQTPVERLDLTPNVLLALKRTGIHTVGEVLGLLAKGEQPILAIRNFDAMSLDELRAQLRKKGYRSSDNENGKKLS